MIQSLDDRVNNIINMAGKDKTVSSRKFYIGKSELIEASIIFIEAFVDKEMIQRSILTPLMTCFNEINIPQENLSEFICKKHITASSAGVEYDTAKMASSIRSGNTIVLVDKSMGGIVVDTKGGEYRPILDPPNESSVSGSREGFVENVDTNITLIRRSIREKNLTVDNYKVGKRSETELVLIFIDDVVDREVLNELIKRIKVIDVDHINDSGVLKQYIEDSPYSPFPQIYGTERVDTIASNILEGRIALIVNGSPQVLTVPTIFPEFFQATEDYSQRTLNSSFARLLRYLTIPLILTLPSIYLTLISYNVELIPVKLISPIIESRRGIYLNPFLEILLMELVVEFLREGGLRLPPRIAQTLSIVGGIIIGNTAVESKVVSPMTLLVIGFTTVATFLIQNYEMSLSLRLIRFPILIATNTLGFLGIIASWYVLLVHLSSLKSMNVEYLNFTKKDMKDTFIRAQLWNMKNRPEGIPNNNPVRQGRFRRGKNGK
jgi:spore germination protein KA